MSCNIGIHNDPKILSSVHKNSKNDSHNRLIFKSNDQSTFDLDKSYYDHTSRHLYFLKENRLV